MQWFSAFLEAEWLMALIRPLRSRYAEVAAISFFTNLLALVVPIFSLQVYDRVVAHQGYSTLVVLIIGALIALTFELLLRLARSRMLQQTALFIDASLGRAFYDKFQHLPLSTLEQHPASHWQALFTDTQLIRGVLSGPSSLLVADLPFVLIFFIVIWIIATPIAWALFIIIPAFVALAWYGTRLQEKSTSQEQRRGRGREKLLNELLHGRATVKALNIDEAVKPDWEAMHAAVIDEAQSRGEQTDLLSSLGQSLAMLSSMLLISLGALAIMDQQMTFGALIATNMLTARLISPFNQLIGQWKQFAQCRQAVTRLDRLFAMPEERREISIERERPRGAITVEKVTFGYENMAAPLLQEASIHFEPGQIYGLVGRNGCGKSTLLKVMQGLYAPAEGRVLLDGADMQQFTRQQLSRWIGYVPQFCFLFDGSIRDNIAKGMPEATDQQILQAAKLAGAAPFIDDLPDGYATEIGEGGNKLSGGQRQRLAIARALLHNPSVLMLDEVTSNLDSETELYLSQVLQHLAKSRLIILATHSMPFIRCCHRLVVMDKGKIVLQGTREEILPKITGQIPNAPTGGDA